MKNEIKIVHTKCYIHEVENIFNRWIENGWVLSNVFIQMLQNTDGTVTIFHESSLNDDARDY